MPSSASQRTKESPNFKLLKKRLAPYSVNGKFELEQWKSMGRIEPEKLIEMGWRCVNEDFKKDGSQKKYPNQCLCEVNIKDKIGIHNAPLGKKEFAIIGNVCQDHFGDEQMREDFKYLSHKRDVISKSGYYYCEVCGVGIPFSTLIKHPKSLETKCHLKCISKLESKIPVAEGSETLASRLLLLKRQRNKNQEEEINKRVLEAREIYQNECLECKKCSKPVKRSILDRHMKIHKDNHEKRIALENALRFTMPMGKYKSTSLFKIYKKNRGYLKWMLDKSFLGANDPLRININVLFNQEKQLKRWILRKKRI